MPHFSFVTLDVFTTTRYLGNPLAIVQVPKGQDVSTEQMQTVAREFNLSETIFLHEYSTGSDGIPEWRVRIFLTNAEVPFAGHPTIGASCYALGTLLKGASKGRLICNAGPIEVDYSDGVARMSIPHNFHRHMQYPLKDEDVYVLHPSLKKAGKKLVAIDVASPVKGMNFICVQLSDLETLGQVDLSGPESKTRLDEEWDVGMVASYLYAITNEPNSTDGVVKVRTRMIQAALEDAATGSGACGLCSYLALKLKLGRETKFEVTQGVEMGRQSDIGVLLTLNENLDAVEKVELSGTSVKVMEGVIEV